MNIKSCLSGLIIVALFISQQRAFAQRKRDTAQRRKDTLSLQKVDIIDKAPNSYKNNSPGFPAKMQEPLIDIPQAVSTVNSKLMEDQMALTLKDIAADVAGVNQYSGYDEYTIRGFRAENARDINGLRGYNSTYTSPMLLNIEKVEFIKGSTATLYGNCDPGGTINLVTKKPLDTLQGVFNIYQGSWQHLRFEGDVTGPINASKTLLYRFNAGYDKTNSFRSGFFAKSFELAPSLAFIPNDKLQLHLDFSVSHTNTVLDRGQPGLLDDPSLTATPISLMISQPGDYLHETDIATTFSLTWKITKNLTFSSGYLNYITRQNVAEHGINDYIAPDSVSLYYSTWHYPTSTNSISNYFNYQAKTGRIDHQLLLGYDFVRSSSGLNQQYYELPDEFGKGSAIVGTMSLRNPQYIKRPISSYKESDFGNDATDVNDDVYHTQGVYLQDHLSWRQWKLLITLREEFYKGEDGLKENVFLPRVGLTYSLQPGFNVYASCNRGFDPFEAATSAQQFEQPFKPILSATWEAGLKGNFFNNRIYASLAVYSLTVQNVAVNANDISNPNLFVQQGENRSQGIEAEVAGTVAPGLDAMLAYAYDVAKVTKSDIPEQVGTIVENAPRNSGSGWIKYTFRNNGLKGFGLSAGYNFAGQRNTLDPGTVLPGYIVFTGGARYSWKHLSLALNVNNITDKTYWTGAYNNVYKWPGVPRNYMVNLGWRF